VESLSRTFDMTLMSLGKSYFHVYLILMLY